MFVNNPLSPLPAYNPGVAFEANLSEKVSISTVYMENKPDDGNFGAIEFRYRWDPINLRPYYYYVFNGEENKGLGISTDVSLTDAWGLFFRGGILNQDQDWFISTGFQKEKTISPKDTVGFGIGMMHGKSSIKNVYAAETYYRYKLLERLSFSIDIQYLKELKEDLVYGGRLHIEY